MSHPVNLLVGGRSQAGARLVTGGERLSGDVYTNDLGAVSPATTGPMAGTATTSSRLCTSGTEQTDGWDG